MERSKTLAAEGGKKNTIVFQLSEFEGRRVFDIRRYFYNESTKNFVPTKKGICISEKTYNILRTVIKEFDTEIDEWLGAHDKVPEAIRKQQERQEKAIISERYAQQKHVRESANWPKSPYFFEGEAHGGQDKIVFNSAHMFYKTLSSIIQDLNVDSSIKNGKAKKIDKLNDLIDKLLITFVRSKSLFDNTPVINTDVFFDTLLFNWGTFLTNYLTEEDD